MIEPIDPIILLGDYKCWLQGRCASVSIIGQLAMTNYLCEDNSIILQLGMRMLISAKIEFELLRK